MLVWYQDEADDATASDLCPLRESGVIPNELPKSRAIFAIKPTTRDPYSAAYPKGHNVGDARLELTTSAV